MIFNKLIFTIKAIFKVIDQFWVKFLLKIAHFPTISKQKIEIWDATFTLYQVIANGVIPKDSLLVRVDGRGLRKIENTPHFSFLNSGGSSSEYENYLKNQFNHLSINTQISNFQELKNSVKRDASTVYVLVKPRFDYKLRFIVVDGAHRAAILAYLGFDDIPVKFTY